MKTVNGHYVGPFHVFSFNDRTMRLLKCGKQELALPSSWAFCLHSLGMPSTILATQQKPTLRSLVHKALPSGVTWDLSKLLIWICSDSYLQTSFILLFSSSITTHIHGVCSLTSSTSPLKAGIISCIFWYSFIVLGRIKFIHSFTRSLTCSSNIFWTPAMFLALSSHRLKRWPEVPW